MECEICNMRSAVGRCSDSNLLVCEECSTSCYRCGKLLATSKGHQTKSGHIYCNACYQDRNARRASRRHQHEGAEAEAAGVAVAGAEGEEEEELEREELILSRWQAPPPWKWSLWFGIIGVVLMGVFIVFPSVRGISLSGNRYLAFGVVALFVPALSLIWAGVGLLGKSYVQDRGRCVFGIALAVLAVVMTAFAAQRPPLPAAVQELNATGSRDSMTKTQLNKWRENFLQSKGIHK